MPGPKGGTGMARRDLLKVAALAALPLPLAVARAETESPPAKSPMLWGVNLAGAEFGKLLGTHGTEYLYPTPANVAYYARLGFTLVRFPFKWERLQPDPGKPFAETELKLLTGVVDEARSQGLTVVLDPHNYAKRRLRTDNWQRDFLIGSDEVPLDAFLDFWTRLADRFKSRKKLIFGLMNEPTEIKAPQWLAIANAAIAAIRANGARNMIFVPGTDWSGAHSWLKAGNTVMEGVRDPLNNFVLEVHQYLDSNSSGTHPETVSSTIGSERIEAFQSWARQHGFRAFLGEYNGGRDAVSARALMDLCDEMRANPDVWLGSAAWAGGPRWPEDYMFNLEPQKGQRMREQTAIIASRAKASAARPYWADASPSLYVDFARGLAMDEAEFYSALHIESGDKLPLDRRGIRLDALQGARLLADGGLAGLFDAPEFTILVELHGVRPGDADLAILTSNGQRLLYRGSGGELGSDLGGGLVTSSRASALWKGKRRCAISLRSGTGEVVIGMTGAPPVAGREAKLSSSPDKLRRIEIGGQAAAGHISRIVGFPTFLGPEDLSANVV